MSKSKEGVRCSALGLDWTGWGMDWIPDPGPDAPAGSSWSTPLPFHHHAVAPFQASTYCDCCGVALIQTRPHATEDGSMDRDVRTRCMHGAHLLASGPSTESVPGRAVLPKQVRIQEWNGRCRHRSSPETVDRSRNSMGSPLMSCDFFFF